MSLLGRPLLYGLGFLAVASPLLAMVLWGRVRGPRRVRATQRVGLIVVAQLLALAFGGVALNDYGVFYTSWSELFGHPPHVAYEQHFGGPSAPARSAPAVRIAPAIQDVALDQSRALVNGHPTTGWSTPADWAVDGAVVPLTLTGASTKLQESVLVYLPPQYFGPTHPPMPLVETFSGFPGQPEGLINRLHYPDLTLEGIKAGRLPPMALVMLRPTTAFPRDTECMDIPNGPPSLTYFANDVPQAVADQLGLTIDALGAVGDSTGGYCALHLGLTQPQRFQAVASLSGYYEARPDRTTGDLFGSDPQTRRDNDLNWRLQHLPQPAASLFVATSLSETGYEGRSAADQFLKRAKAPLTADEIVLSSGGHNFSTWRLEIPRALQFLGDHLAPTPPAPAASPAATVVG